MIHYTFRVAEIATHLLCKKPVLVTGPVGSGKFNAAIEAMEMVSPSTNGSLSYINVEMQYARYSHQIDFMWELGVKTKPLFLDKFKRVLEKNPKKNLVFSSVERATPEMVAPMLEQMLFSDRRTVLVGDWSMCGFYAPLVSRCHIVRM